MEFWYLIVPALGVGILLLCGVVVGVHRESKVQNFWSFMASMAMGVVVYFGLLLLAHWTIESDWRWTVVKVLLMGLLLGSVLWLLGYSQLRIYKEPVVGLKVLFSPMFFGLVSVAALSTVHAIGILITGGLREILQLPLW